MSTIPFEQYVAEWEEKARRRGDTKAAKEDRCTSCMRERPKLTADGYCHECLRYSWGYDDGEQGTAKAILGGAVTAAPGRGGVLMAVLLQQAHDHFERGEWEAGIDALERALCDLIGAKAAS